MAKKLGDGYFSIDDPDDEAAILRYRQAVSEVLAQFENMIKLVIKHRDRVGLESVKGDVLSVLEKAENTLRKPGA